MDDVSEYHIDADSNLTCPKCGRVFHIATGAAIVEGDTTLCRLGHTWSLVPPVSADLVQAARDLAPWLKPDLPWMVKK